MKKLKEVIVVEGKDDTAQIHKAVNADTIETRGSAVSPHTIQLIKKLAKRRGIIIFTDPDFSGERIRRIVARAVPNAKHAFIPRDKAVPKHRTGSLGVEHADPQVIRKALAKAYPARVNEKPKFKADYLVKLGLIGGSGSRILRTRLCKVLNIGYVNGKQLSKRLRMFGITERSVNEAMKKIKTGDHHE
ncbi:MAG: ribonuclease M5 [Acetilactobacillus jinshanensis]